MQQTTMENQEPKQPTTATPDIQQLALPNPAPENKQKTITTDRYTQQPKPTPDK
jgi:hypothetical protein